MTACKQQCMTAPNNDLARTSVCLHCLTIMIGCLGCMSPHLLVDCTMFSAYAVLLRDIKWWLDLVVSFAKGSCNFCLTAFKSSGISVEPVCIATPCNRFSRYHKHSKTRTHAQANSLWVDDWDGMRELWTGLKVWSIACLCPYVRSAGPYALNDFSVNVQ